MRTGRLIGSAGLLAALLAFAVSGARPASASPMSFEVYLDTSADGWHAGDPFALAFQLIDGSGLDPADANNSALIGDFDFGAGGSAGLADSMFVVGSGAGAFNSSVTLTDTEFFNSYGQWFTPGDALSFVVTLTTNMGDVGWPDAFSIHVLRQNGGDLEEIGGSTLGALVQFDLVGDATVPVVDPPDPLAGYGSGPVVSQVPEPASLSSLLVGLSTLAAYRLRGWRPVRSR